MNTDTVIRNIGTGGWSHQTAGGQGDEFYSASERAVGKNTHVGGGLTEYTLDGERVGYGLSESLDQPEE